MTELEKSLNKNNVSTEPALAVGVTGTSVAGILSLVLYFFPEIPSSYIQGLLVSSAFLLPIITALFTRGKVWSPASVQAIIDEAVKDALEQAEKERSAKVLRSLREAKNPLVKKPITETTIRPATEI